MAYGMKKKGGMKGKKGCPTCPKSGSKKMPAKKKTMMRRKMK